MNLREELNKLDHIDLDRGSKFFDLRNMFDSMVEELSTQDKQKLKQELDKSNTTSEDVYNLLLDLEKDDNSELFTEDIDNNFVSYTITINVDYDCEGISDSDMSCSDILHYYSDDVVRNFKDRVVQAITTVDSSIIIDDVDLDIMDNYMTISISSSTALQDNVINTLYNVVDAIEAVYDVDVPINQRSEDNWDEVSVSIAFYPSVDNIYSDNNDSKYEMNEAIEPDRKAILDSMLDIRTELENYLKDKYPNYEIYDIDLNKISFLIDGDWKHDHLRFDYLVKGFLRSKDIEFNTSSYALDDSDDDVYEGVHTYTLNFGDYIDAYPVNEAFENYPDDLDGQLSWDDYSSIEDSVTGKINSNSIEDVFLNNGFELDKSIRHENPQENLFGGMHYQIINPNVKFENQEQFKSVIMPFIDALDKFEKDNNVAITWNFGANADMNITAGVDVRELRPTKNESLNENFGKDGYFYVLKHYGPGALPKDVEILDSIDLPNGYTGVWVNRFFSTKELNEYDIPSETKISSILDRLGIDKNNLK